MNVSNMLKLFFMSIFIAFLTASETVAVGQFKDFGGFSLKVQYPNNHKNVIIKEKKTFKIDGLEYLAINYYEAILGQEYTYILSVAVLKKSNGKYISLFDKKVHDTGQPGFFESTFLFKSKDNNFIVFEVFNGAHNMDYCIIRVSKGKAKEIPMENYYINPLVKDVLKPGEWFCRGTVYSFEDGRIWGFAQIFKQDDGCCCPTGGELVFSHKFDNDVFKITKVKRE